MATDDTKIGFDPLAWMNEDDDTEPKITAKGVEAESSQEEGPLGLNIKLLQDSFELLKPQGEELVHRFYGKLFEKYPAVKPLFANTTQKEQEKKLLAALALVVNNLRNPDALANALKEMGKRHQNYGALPDHYPAVAETLLESMAELAGNKWTPNLQSAWQKALNVVAEVMTSAYTKNMETREMATSSVDDKLTQMLTAAVSGSTTALMVCDDDLNIVFCNPSVVQLLKNREAELRSVFPGFDADNLLGTNIDIFHKNPAHQRSLLKDPSRLPY